MENQTAPGETKMTLCDLSRLEAAQSSDCSEVWREVRLSSPVDLTAKEWRWWLERRIKHRFALRTSWSTTKGEDVASLWNIMGWYHRQNMLREVNLWLSSELNWSLENTATFAFEDRREAMLFKLTFGGT